MHGGKREGAGRKPQEGSNTSMFFLRVSSALREKIRVLTPAEARQALEIAAEKKYSQDA